MHQSPYFKAISPGEVTKTISFNDYINVDLDKEGKAIGIEILDVSKNIPADSLKSASLI